MIPVAAEMSVVRGAKFDEFTDTFGIGGFASLVEQYPVHFDSHRANAIFFRRTNHDPAAAAVCALSE